MEASITHLLAALALVAAPASLGMATQTDDLPVIGTSNSDAEGEEANVIEKKQREFDEKLTEGELDLRIDRGAVRVVAWEKNAYQVKVLQEPTDDTQTDQRETTVDITDESSDGKLNLTVVVDREGPSGPTVHAQDERAGFSNPERAIVVQVPAHVDFSKVHTCSGQAWSAQSTGLTGEVSVGEDECVENEEPTPTFTGDVYINAGDEKGLNVTTGVVGLQGDELVSSFENEDVQLVDVDFATTQVQTENGDLAANGTAEKLTLATENGDVTTEVDATEATVDTENGDITLAGDVETVTAKTENGDVALASESLSEGDIDTQNGDIDLKILPAGSGQLDLATENGEISVHLGHADNVGYDATGESENGDVTVDLVDEQQSDKATDTEAEYDQREQESARTANYDAKEIQLELTATSENGDITIVEDGAGNDEDEDDDSSTTTQQLSALT